MGDSVGECQMMMVRQMIGRWWGFSQCIAGGGCLFTSNLYSHGNISNK